jgi:hypothetical protein
VKIDVSASGLVGVHGRDVAVEDGTDTVEGGFRKVGEYLVNQSE